MSPTATLNAVEQEWLQRHCPELCRLLYYAGSTAPAEVAAELQRLTAAGILPREQARKAAVCFRSRRAAAQLRRYRRSHPMRTIYNAAFFAEEA